MLFRSGECRPRIAVDTSHAFSALLHKTCPVKIGDFSECVYDQALQPLTTNDVNGETEMSDALVGSCVEWVMGPLKKSERGVSFSLLRRYELTFITSRPQCASDTNLTSVLTSHERSSSRSSHTSPVTDQFSFSFSYLFCH